MTTLLRTPSAASPSAPLSAPRTVEPPGTGSPHPSAAAIAGLVGEWARINSCESYVAALDAAGFGADLDRWLVDFGGYWSSPDEIPAGDPCVGALEVEHSHFFTDNGRFGSRDEHGNQVDNGDYDLAGDATLAFPSHEDEFGFSPIVVGYAIGEDGNLEFTVDVPDSCVDACEIANVWAISAFYPGPFQRK